MINRVFWGAAMLLLVGCVLGVQTLRHGFFVVQPTEGALILDYKGRVLRQADIGLNLRNPFLETVWVTEVTRERTVRIEGLWSAPDCTLDGIAVWTVDDLPAFYQARKTVLVARRVSELASAVAYDAAVPFGLEGEAFLDWSLAYRHAVRGHPELADLGVDVVRAYPVEAPCAQFGP